MNNRQPKKIKSNYEFLFYMLNFVYTATSDKPFALTVEAISRAIGEAGMRVLHIHDVQQTLAEKGFARPPFKIIEFCSAKYASTFLEKDPLIGLCMPCKINVYEQSGQVIIAAMRPTVLPEFFPNLGLDEQVAEIDRLIHNIVNQAKSDLNKKGGGI